MSRRTIVIYPEFPDTGRLQELRQKFDPRVDLVRPHITLVYPFDSDHSQEQLIPHVASAARAVAPFRLLARVVSGFADTFLLLNLKVGNDSVILLHDLLYGGPLQQFYNPVYTFFPHVVVGRVDDPADLKRSLREVRNWNEALESKVSQIAVDLVLPDGLRKLEATIELGTGRVE